MTLHDGYFCIQLLYQEIGCSHVYISLTSYNCRILQWLFLLCLVQCIIYIQIFFALTLFLSLAHHSILCYSPKSPSLLFFPLPSENLSIKWFHDFHMALFACNQLLCKFCFPWALLLTFIWLCIASKISTKSQLNCTLDLLFQIFLFCHQLFNQVFEMQYISQ